MHSHHSAPATPVKALSKLESVGIITVGFLISSFLAYTTFEAFDTGQDNRAHDHTLLFVAFLLMVSLFLAGRVIFDRQPRAGVDTPRANPSKGSVDQ